MGLPAKDTLIQPVISALNLVTPPLDVLFVKGPHFVDDMIKMIGLDQFKGTPCETCAERFFEGEAKQNTRQPADPNLPVRTQSREPPLQAGVLQSQ